MIFSKEEEESFYKKSFVYSKNKNITHWKNLIKEIYQETYSEKLAFNILSTLKNKFGYDNTSNKIRIKNKTYSEFSIKSITHAIWCEHLLHNKNYSLPIHPNSNVLWVDIDEPQLKKKSFDEIHRILTYYFGKEILVFKKKHGLGYHIMYLYDKSLNEKTIKNIENCFNTQEIDLEIKTNGRWLKLPYSKDYSLCGNFNETGEFITYRDHPIKIMYDILSNISAQSLTDFLNMQLDETIDYYHNKEYETSWTPSSYGRGDRHEFFFKLGFYLLRNNPKSTLEKFKQQCEYWNDGTSYDMQKGSYFKYIMIESYWNWIKLNFNKKYSDNKFKPIILEDNTYLELKRDYDKEFSDLKWDTIKYIIEQTYQKNNLGKIGTKNYNRTITSCLLLYENVWQKSFYTKTRKYKKDINKPLEQGININTIEKNTIAKNLRIKNIRKCFKILLLSGLLTILKNKKGHTYRFNSKNNFCLHYFLNNVYMLYKSLKLYKISLYSCIYYINIVVKFLYIFYINLYWYFLYFPPDE